VTGGRFARRWRRLLSSTVGAPDPDILDRLGRVVAGLRRDVQLARAEADDLARQLEAVRGRAEQAVSARAVEIRERASLAALPVARLRSSLVTLSGSPSRRLTARRHRFGAHLALPVRPWMGETACTTRTADVRELWDRLLAAEADCVDDRLRAEPGSVLDLAGATISNAGTLHLALGADAAAPRNGTTIDADVVAVPRFTYDFPARKLRNLGHWILDCVPHVLALARLAPDAVFLLPPLPGNVHWSALALAAIERERVIPWDGSPVGCRRLLVQETDGRISRGRPLPQLLDLRRHLDVAARRPDARRRIYVSRRDAKPHRQWLANHDDVEQLFRSHGFEILVMRESSMAQQARMFGDARIVAGISGAGLASIAFAPAGAHVITLVTDSLLRWYAEEQGTRSAWASGRLPAGGLINELTDSPRFYAHLAAVCEQYCHTFVGEDILPTEQLGRFLEQVLERIEE